jgi:CHAT domain-containing protein/tetratricopeptide (TPR) repeat protein
MKPLSAFFLFLCLVVIFGLQTASAKNTPLVCDDENALNSAQIRAESLSLEWNKTAFTDSINIFKEISLCLIQKRDFEKAAYNLRRAGNLSVILGNDEQASKFFLKALNLAEKSAAPDEQIYVLCELALFSIKNGQINLTRSYLEKARAFSGRTENDSVKAMVSFSAAESAVYQRDLSKAIESYVEALNFARQSNDVKIESKILLNLGYGYLYHGEVNRAFEILKEGLALHQKIGDKRGEAFNTIAIANTLAFLDNRQKALNYYKKVEAGFSDDLDFVEKARLYNGIASIYVQYEDWSSSINYRTKALSFFQKANFKYGELATLSGIGRLYSLNGEKNSALDIFFQAEKLAADLDDRFYMAVIQKELGNIHSAAGENRKALEKYLRSISLLEQIKSTRELALVYNEVGELYAKQNDFLKAREYLEKGLKLNQAVRDSFAESHSLYNLAKLFAGNQTDNKTGLTFIINSINITENLYSDVLNSKLKRIYFSNVFDRYELYINLLMKMHRQNPNSDYAIQALQAAERSRARSMLENLALAEADFIKDADAEIVRREKEIRVLLNAKADKLTDLLSQNGEKSEIDKISGEINELEHELEEIKANLKQNSPVYSAIKNPAPFDAEEFQREILDENTLLLEFSFGKEESYLWLIGKMEISSYVLPPREQIEQKIQTLRELLAAREIKQGEEIEAFQARVVKAENDYLQISLELSRELFGQIADKFGEKRLIIVPDGKLNYFPVSALPLPNAETNEPILLSNEVIYEPSASTLSILAKMRNQTAASKNLLVFSDPVFSETDSRFLNANAQAANPGAETALTEKFRFAESLNSLVRLTASKTEADSIIEILGRSKSDAFSGFSANREQLLNAPTSDYKILHFATHGLINEERPELSGIVLSRFAENGQKLDEFVRLHDIYGMNLNADLVVLSACETGIGKQVRGEGLMSLNNAFLQTGAKSVMSSLWKVEDAATLELMKNFYASLAGENVTPSKALQKAQIKMWQSGQYKSPFYWAAFTVQGDFRRTPDFSRDFSYMIFFAATVSAILLIGLFWLYRLRRR